jgi:iron complex outermembrane receptor protein
MSLKKLAAGVALTTLAQLAAGAAHAQSTGTNTVQEIVVTGTRTGALGGLVAAQEAPKTRDVVTQAYISAQPAGANAMSDLNLIPGVNFTQDDPFGLAGSAGHISIRGLKGANIGEMEDGMPLNDAGNYAVYAGERLDAEVLASVNIITGSSEVDAPSASSLGGTINYNSLMPTDKFGGLVDASGGSFGEYRVAGLVQSGRFGPWGTKGWIEGSYSENNKFTGVGNDWKWQVNGKVYQDLNHDGDFVAAAVFYDRQVADNYDGVDFASTGATTGSNYYPVTTAGYNFHGLLTTPWNNDYNKYYVLPGSSSTNTYFQGLQLNPTDTGNIRGSSRFTLLPDLKLTVDPSYQWVLATGGTLSTTIAGTNALLIGPGTLTANHSNFPACYNAAGQITGIDLDGATTSTGAPSCADSTRVVDPSITQTSRFTVNTDLIWTPTPQHLFQLAYSYDHANVRQTGDYGTVNANGSPSSVFAGLPGWGGTPILAADGSPLEKRNRLTLATLNQVSLEYIGKYFDDHLRVDLGVRDPFIARTLNQYCYTSPPTSVLCTSYPSVAAAQKYTVLPFTLNKNYNKPLPNVGATWNFDKQNSIFVDYTEALNAPVNDDLYAIALIGTSSIVSSPTTPGADNVQPETSKTIEGGYRYQTSRLRTTIDAYAIEDDNHIVSAYNQATADSVDTNVGSIQFYGFEGQAAWLPIDHLTLVGSFAYEHSEVQSNIPYSATYQIPTKGKQFYDTPPWMIGGSATYDWNYWTFGGQVKYVDARYATALNDLQVPSYVTVDANVRLKLDWVRPGAYLQLNVINLFDEKYIGSINYGTTNNNTLPGYSEQYAFQGAPRTVQGTIRMTF